MSNQPILIQVDDQAARAALQGLIDRAGNTDPLLLHIGQGIEDRIDQRFADSKGPDGSPWKSNSPVTLGREALRLAVSKSNRKKNGGLNARGARLLAGKKPLIGESGTLRSQIVASVSGNELSVTAATIYARIQQFGGKKAEFPHLWGDIPARPFMPVTTEGEIYPTEAALIQAAINEYLLGR